VNGSGIRLTLVESIAFGLWGLAHEERLKEILQRARSKEDKANSEPISPEIRVSQFLGMLMRISLLSEGKGGLCRACITYNDIRCRIDNPPGLDRCPNQLFSLDPSPVLDFQ
jgi:hypothetical protein